jgi:protein TonB
MAPHAPAQPKEEPESPPVVDTSTTLAASAGAPRFTMVLASGSAAGGVASEGHGAGPVVGHGDDDGLGALPESAVDTRARLLRGVTPSYPSDARAEGVEAKVQLELVVSPTGSVVDVHVKRRAGHGLDEAAVVAARQFHFSPALRQGHAVGVRMSWAVDFRLD